MERPAAITRRRVGRENFTADQEAREKELRANAWDHTHRNERSIAIDLKKPEGQAILHRLVKDADVFFGSFRLGVYKRLGADYETLSKINPRLIYLCDHQRLRLRQQFHGMARQRAQCARDVRGERAHDRAGR